MNNVNVQDSRQDLRQYSDEELSLIVMNDEGLYIDRHKSWFISQLEELFLFTDEQLEVLKQDLEDDLKESLDIIEQ